MKNTLIYLLLFISLLQSCFSYRSIEIKNTPLVEGKKYKIQEKNTFIKAKLVDVNDTIATFKKEKIKKEIRVSEIAIIKVKQFSYFRTISLVAGISIIALLMDFLDSSLGGDYYKDTGNSNPI
ncbi:hypothetical protein [Flavobacterium sp.]|uniref:hypothetical protein n=1 Tax=Flavobacterium sp. TaxID=239 RepID=UPI00286E4E6D|nr:hypothetical protein [Flavobacterium sp.]